MKRAFATFAAVLAMSLASGVASAAAPPSLTAARAARAIPYPVLPVIKAKAAFPVRLGAGITVFSPCSSRSAGTLTIPAYIEHSDSYSRVSVKANTHVDAQVTVYVFKTAAASAAALKVLAHAEHACPHDSSVQIGSFTLRTHIVADAATTIAGWPGWQAVDRSAIVGHPDYTTRAEEFVRRGNALLDVWVLADDTYAKLPAVQKQARQVTAAMVARLGAQFR